MKKRLFAIMLALAMVLAAVPALAEEGEATEVPETSTKIICKVCEKDVGSVDENGLCEACAAKKAEEEAARKAAEKKETKEPFQEVVKKEVEKQEIITEVKTTKTPVMLLSESSTEGTETDNKCYHNHTAAWANTQPGVQGTMVWHEPTESTCAKEGNFGYYQCNKCGKYFKKNGEQRIDQADAIKIELKETVIPKTDEHKLGEKVTGKPATCTEDGIKEHYKCSVCGKSFSDSDGKIEITDTTIPALNHSYGDPTWAWSSNYIVATATFNCTREGCNESQTIKATVTTSNEYGNCYVYTRYTAKVTGPDGKDYSDSKTTNCRRPDWYYDPCYYNNPCGHWGCGNVCTRYSNCVPCRDYRTTFRVGGYNCLATPKTGDVSVIGMALISLAGAGAAIMGKKRK